MAVSRRTQKDIGNYEAKLMGPFTTRQVIFLAIGIVPSVFVAYVLYMFSIDIYTIFAFIAVIMAVPCFFAFGSSLTYGMKPEEFLKEYYKYHILAPKKRLYKTETLDDVLWNVEDQNRKTEVLESEEKSSKKKTKSLKTFGKMKLYPHTEDEEYKDFE